MKYLLGLDIGSVNAKLALLDENGNVLHLDIERIISNPRIAVNTLFSRLAGKFNPEQAVSIGVSGSGKSAIPASYSWPEYSSSLSVISGLLKNNPDARTIIQIGGQSSLVIELEDGLKKPWKLTSNSLCAAGTGRFLEQQAYRLGISIEDFAAIALRCHETPPRIAARCSVFAKTDLIHLQQKGVSVESMLYALSESIARMVASLKKGAFEEPVYFIGGVAGNAAIVKALEDVLSVRNGHEVKIIVPGNFIYIEATGAALLSKDKKTELRPLPEADAKSRYFEMPKLKAADIPGNGTKLEVKGHCTGYLGVDVGSTSTKAVILDESGKKILAKNYLMTAGRPVDAVKQVMRNLLEIGADKVKIGGVGVTGSGRYLIGSLIGADLVKNEITAQTRAAYEIDPEADIIEIGGQDSKLVIKRNGVVVDYQMNKACAAGTGSFIDELAELLGVSVKDGNFARLAFSATHTIDLGTRCAAFMGQAVASAQQEGVPLKVITASLAGSIAKNYLSKVVGTRKLGDRIILTGAVFYNQAVVAAFTEQLKDKKLTIAEHREVSGAIGAAMLARERMRGERSKFRGFKKIAETDCNLTTFICNGCDNNCTITRMSFLQEGPGEKPTFYGSRCDKYDSTVSHHREETFFDAREKLLFADYNAPPETEGTGPVVGIPRSLIIYDFAPLFIGYLNALKAKVVLSSQTSKEIIEQSTELAYSDSCFPVKLLHGHTATLKDADYILYPCAIRLSLKDGEENQRYACPLVQASPFIIRETMGLKGRLIIPIIDFSMGNAEVISNLTKAAVEMGFSRKEGKKAALRGLEAQQRFEKGRKELGAKLLAELHESGKLGVVIIARSYMAQDAGANLGIADKLAQLGVVPVPLDFLPIDDINPKKYSDRPYWSYEGKFIAAAELVAKDTRLYGLFLSNFGCGPDSFIIRIVEDILGGKPLGQLEIDEHAAEAGLVTRLEAFVDTIEEYDRAGKPHETNQKDIYRGSLTSIDTGKTLLIPRMAPQAEVIAGVMGYFGVNAAVLPEPDERNLLYANQVTAGTECLPFRVTLGDFMRFHYENGHDLKNVEGFMSGSYGPCRLGKYAVEQIRILKDIGFNLPIRTSVSNNAYRDLGLRPGFERLAWKGIVATDGLLRLRWRTRPYEKEAGSADRLFDDYLHRMAQEARKNGNFGDLLRRAAAEFKAIVNQGLPRRPLIGINGEIYLRSNDFSNNNLVRTCEAAGLEVIVSPMGEWFNYTSYRNFEDAVRNRNFSGAVISYLKKMVQTHDEHTTLRSYRALITEKELGTEELLAVSKEHLSPRCGSEAVLSIGGGIKWLGDPAFAGVISVMPHGCMPGGIVAAMAEKFTGIYEKPWISLTYDGFAETNNLTRINEFAELIRFCQKNQNIASVISR